MQSGMPPPMTDPLAMQGQGDAESASERLEQKAIDDEYASISKGMPARNLKTWGILALAFLAAGYFFWPTLFPKKPGAAVPIEAKQSIQAQPGQMVAQLQAQPKTASQATQGDSQTNPEQATPTASLPAPKAGTTFAGSPAGDSETSAALSPSEITEKRRETIVASSMEAAEVNIPGASTGGRVKQVKATGGDPKSALTEALDRQNSILEKSLAPPQEKKPVLTPEGSAQENFILKTKEKSMEPAVQLSAARNPGALYQGTIIRVILDRAINTDSPGEIRGHVKSDIFDSVGQNILLIPRGSVVLGPYQSSMLVGQARILVAGSRLILPNGKSINLMGTPAADLQGASGIPADVDNHFFEMFKTSLIVGAASLLLPTPQQNVTISTPGQGSSQTGGSILGTTLYDTIKQVSSRNANIKPTGTVELGEEFTLMLSHDVEMQPYGASRSTTPP